MLVQKAVEVDFRDSDSSAELVGQQLSRGDPTPNAAGRDREQFCNLSDGIEACYCP